MLNVQNLKFKVTTFDIDFLRRATPKAILGYMEETATKHADKLGFSYEESNKQGFFWVLRSSKYTLRKTPRINDEVNIKTYLVGFNGLKTLRKFEFSINDEIIGYGYNHWIMIDYDNKKPIMNVDFVNKVNSLYPNNQKAFKLPRLRYNDKMKKSYQKVVMNNDIDMNQHVNNVKYAEIIFNAIPIDLIQDKDIQSLHIDYLKECKLNDMIDVFLKVDNDKILVEGRINEMIVFKSIIETK